MLFGFATLGLRFDGESINRSGLGGSETAVICMAREMAKRGHEVHVFCLCDLPGIYAGVAYHKIEDLVAFNESPGFDVYVCSRFTELYASPINAKLKLLWLHDMPTNRDRLMQSLWQVDKIILLSQFQINEYLKVVPEIEPLIWKSSNGVDLDLVNANLRPKVPGKLIYTSRPERGLIYLLRDIFPKLLVQNPDLKLHVCAYDLPGIPVHESTKAVHEECNRLIRELAGNVVMLGSLNKAQLYQEISSSQALLYPTDFPEISCISLMEAQACGTYVISTDDFALAETVNHSSDGINTGALLNCKPTDVGYADSFAFIANWALSSDRLEPREDGYTEIANGQAWITQQGFTWPQVAEKWERMAAEELVIQGYELSVNNIDAAVTDSRLQAGKHLLLIGFGNYGVPFEGNAIETAGLGGSETAIICLARELAKQGHDVHVFNVCSKPGLYHGVHFHRVEEELPTFADKRPFDVFVCAQSERLLATKPMNARLNIYWAQGQFWQIGEKHINGLLWQTDKIATISEFQRKSFREAIPALSEMLWDAPNGVDLQLVAANHRDKEPGKLIYLSRPERGLIYLLRDIYPRLLAERPDLKLYVCTYKIPGMELPPNVQAIYEECDRLIAELCHRVVKLGSLTKAELYQQISSSQVVVYPCHFEEAGCIAALESQACGTPIVTTNDYALMETADSLLASRINGKPTSPEYIDEFVRLTLYHLNSNIGLIGDAGPEWIKEKKWQWKDIAAKWEQMFYEELDMPRFRMVGADSVRRVDGSYDINTTFETRAANHEPTVAVCLIAKNEENDLRRCLQRVAPYVDEVHIVVDDSTTDDTIGVIERYQAETKTPINYKIRRFDNFAQMRNESTVDVKTDWILWVDADEELLGGDCIRQYLKTKFFNGYVIRQRHLMLDVPESIDTPVRLYRNLPHYRFTGFIHEHCEDISKGPFDHQISPAMVLSDVQIAHRGYTNEHVRREKVSNRNMRLLRRSLREQPDRQMTWAMAARDCLTVPRWEISEKGKIEFGSIHHKMLCAAIEIFLSKFDDESNQYYAMAYPIYEDVCRLLSQMELPAHGRNHPPFEVAMGMLGTVLPGGLTDRKKLEGRGYWFVDEFQFRELADAKRDKLLSILGLQLVQKKQISIDTAQLGQTVIDLLGCGDGIVPHKYAKHEKPHAAA